MVGIQFLSEGQLGKDLLPSSLRLRQNVLPVIGGVMVACFFKASTSMRKRLWHTWNHIFHLHCHIPFIRNKSQAPPMIKEPRRSHADMIPEDRDCRDCSAVCLKQPELWLQQFTTFYIQNASTPSQDSQEYHPIIASAPQSHYLNHT